MEIPDRKVFVQCLIMEGKIRLENHLESRDLRVDYQNQYLLLNPVGPYQPVLEWYLRSWVINENYYC
jgi:hypothetical protein